MSEAQGTSSWCEVYIRQARLIGAAYSIVPTLVSFGVLFSLHPFRGVYVLRLVLALLGGGMMGAMIHRYGVSLWLTKHRSAEGPATVGDGVLFGAAVGFGGGMITPLTALIRSNHMEIAKSYVICYWLGALIIGAIIGGALASAARRRLAGATKG